MMTRGLRATDRPIVFRAVAIVRALTPNSTVDDIRRVARELEAHRQRRSLVASRWRVWGVLRGFNR